MKKELIVFSAILGLVVSCSSTRNATDTISPVAETRVAESAPEDSSHEEIFTVVKADTAMSVPDTISSNTEPASSTHDPDLYQEIPRLVERSLFLADSLLAAGNPDAALEVVEKFYVLKPLWQEWMQRAAAIESKVRSFRTSQSEALKPLTLEIINRNASSASYEEVHLCTDSLIAHNPPDSLVNWAKQQAMIAYHKTYAKVQTERQKALTLARDKAFFDEAEKMVMTAIMRYPSFVDTLQLKQALILISGMRMEESEKDKVYWKSHDPKAAFAEARELERKGKYREAKQIWVKLKASVLRKESLGALDSLAETYCTRERTTASTLFSKSKQHPEKAKDLLAAAIAALDRCLTEFPENKQHNKVVENKMFLEKELEK